MIMRKRILLIDDSPVLAECLADTLDMEGYDVIIASNGIAARTIMKDNTPDLIITDFSLTAIDDIEFIRIVRRETSIPVIAISSNISKESANASVHAGAHLFLTMPFDEEIFIQEIANFLNK